LNPAGRRPVGIEPFDLGLHSRNDVVGVLGNATMTTIAVANIVVVIPATDSTSAAHNQRNTRDVLDLDRKTVEPG